MSIAAHPESYTQWELLIEPLQIRMEYLLAKAYWQYYFNKDIWPTT